MSERPDTILIEADTIESALEALTERYGSNATIVSAERVRRGGVAGFFSTEVVELVAIPPVTGRHVQEEPAERETVPDTAIGGVDDAFARLLDAAEQEEVPTVRAATAVGLLEHTEPATTPETGASARTAAHTEAPVSGIRWDVPRLIEIGLPGSLIEDLMPLDPDDDLAHVERLARSLAPLTGDLPAEPHHLIGARTGRRARHVDVPDRSRPVHLVLGKGDDLDVTKPPPAIVSWTSDATAPTAIAVAWQTGALLGWSASTDGDLRRVTPVDAALAIRRLLEKR